MLQQIYSLLNGMVAVITFVFGILFLFMTIPNKKEFHNYHICRKLLALAYFIMGGLNLVELFINQDINDSFVNRFVTVIISLFQAFLFTYALITLFNTQYLTRTRMIRELFPVAILTIFCSLALAIHLPTIVLNTIFYTGIAYYVFQLIYYTVLFNRQYILYQNKLSDYFSEKESLRLRWTRFSFFAALSIGVIALTSLFLGSPLVAVLFLLIFTFFYIYFGIKYLNYTFVFNFIEPVIYSGYTSQAENNRQTTNEVSLALEHWVQNKGFIKTGITLVDLAAQLNTNRTYLSNYINQQKEMNYNAWINWLRVEEGKILLLKQPQMPIAEVSEKLGYSEQSNFGRYFLKYTGKTPGQWRKDAVK